MRCSVLIDWLTFSVKTCNDPYTVINWYLGMDASLFQPMPYGLNGYTDGLEFNNIMVLYNPCQQMKNHDSGVCVSMSGNGCRTFEQFSKLTLDGCIDKQGTVNCTFPALFQLICCNDCNVSRIDIACDDHDGALDLDMIASCVRDKNMNTRMQYRQIVESFDGSGRDGFTIYLGAPSSDFRVRFYDKAAQLQEAGHWVRCELVLKGKNALGFVQNFVNCDSLGTLTCGVINDKFSFIDRDDSNICRCSVCSWWVDFLGSLESVCVFSREVVQHPIEYIRDWVVRQVAPSLGMLYKAYGAVAFYEDIVKDGFLRMTGKQEQLCADFREFLSNVC